MFRQMSAAGLVALISVAAQAQDTERHETPHVVVTTQLPAAPIAAGARVTLKLDVEPKAKMHVYSPEQKDYIPVSLTIDKNPAITASPAVFPKAEKYFFKDLDETQPVYSKPFQVVQPVTLAKSVKPGDTILVKGTLKYQACDDAICYRPQEVRVSWKLTVR